MYKLDNIHSRFKYYVVGMVIICDNQKVNTDDI